MRRSLSRHSVAAGARSLGARQPGMAQHPRQVRRRRGRHRQRARGPGGPRARVAAPEPEGLLGEPEPLALERGPVGARGVDHRERVVVAQPPAAGAGARAPVEVLRQPSAERAHVVEHLPAGGEVGGHREALLGDVARVVEGEDGLEGLRARARRGRLMEDLDAPAHQVGGARAPERRQPGLDPARGRHAVGVEEQQPRRGALGHAAVARGRGPLPGLDHEAREGVGGHRRRGGLGRGVVDHHHLGARQVRARQRREASREPLGVVVVGDDDGCFGGRLGGRPGVGPARPSEVSNEVSNTGTRSRRRPRCSGTC